jgi:hypothetical protein
MRQTKAESRMIGFFTDPYPDELLYSACARYHHRSRNLSKEATALDLFGNVRSKFIVDLPVRLDYLAAQLPSETYSASQLIEEHTMLPFYAPFMPPERHEAIRRDMRGDGGGSIHARLGILTSGISVENLRFCPACVEDDVVGYGEPYWHRLHQAPGVQVCPTHRVFLSDSELQVRNRRSGRALVTLRQAIEELPSMSRAAHPLDLEDQKHHVLLLLARDAAWILGAQIEAPGHELLRRRYQHLLLEHNMSSYTGTVKHTPLKARFLDYYSTDLLERLGCGLELRYHWLRRLINDWKRTRHPLHHLLLMQFLKTPAEEFFRLSVELRPFGKGPWPCLNAAGGHFREMRITGCQINNMQRDRKRFMGTFECECGFSYRRTGADTTPERQYQYDRILSFGEAWYEKLRSMLAVGKYSRHEIAQALGVSAPVVDRESRRLERSIELGLPVTKRYEQSGGTLISGTSQMRDEHRKRWNEIKIENPDMGRYMLSRMEPRSYYWLLKHDRAWLESNCPDRLKNCGTSPRVDWSERDDKYASDVRETAARMLNALGRPVRASRTGISISLGILSVLTKNASKFPLTDKALDDVSESQTAFAIRRIRWSADCYCREQIRADRWKLQTRAAVSNKMARNPEVKAAIEACAQFLRVMNEFGWEASANSQG